MARVNVTSELGLNISSHSKIDFLDIYINDDVALFIDPCLIDVINSQWCMEARRTIHSYFDEFFRAYRDYDLEMKKYLFSHAHEVNDTKLGYGDGDNGNGNTTDGLILVFRELERLIHTKMDIRHPIDLHVMIEDFAEDGLSDMVTNIIRKHLNDFTLEQCQKWGIQTDESEEEFAYWDYKTSSWSMYKDRCLYVGTRKQRILLVPKSIVRHEYYYSADQYFSGIILQRLKEESAIRNAAGKINMIPKKELRRRFRKDNEQSVREIAIDKTIDRPEFLDEYHAKMQMLYSDKSLSDDFLDKFIYEQVIEEEVG